MTTSWTRSFLQQTRTVIPILNAQIRDHPEMGTQNDKVDGGISERTWGKRGSDPGQEVQFSVLHISQKDP
jgi:hypothetical protein